MELRALITGCGASEIKEDVYWLKSNGEVDVYVVGVDIKNHVDTDNLDAYYTVHSGETEEFIDDLLRICKDEMINVVIPTVDPELKNLSLNVDKFVEIGVTVCVMDRDRLEPCIDKAEMYETLELLGISVPKYAVVYDMNELKDALISFDYENTLVCVKSPYGFGSRGIRIINERKNYFDAFMNEKPRQLECNLDMLKCYLGNNDFKLVVMEYIDGIEYSVNALAMNGKVLFICGKTNLDVIDSSPSVIMLGKNDKAYNLAIEIIDKLCLDGFIGIDFIIDKNGDAKVLEINPRITATVPTISMAGVNYLYLGVKMLIGGEINDIEIKKDVTAKKICQYKYFVDDLEDV